MLTQMKPIIILLIVIPFYTTRQDIKIRQLNELLQAYQRNGHFNGSVFISKSGTVLLHKGYGWQNKEAGIKNTENSIYQIASITKPFTATVVLKLVEQGRLSLDDRLESYYTGFTYGDSITIRDLLRHTSGIHNFTETDTTIETTNEVEIIDFIRSLKPDFRPGTNWNYSNSGYVILGYIIQKAAGMTYWDAVRKYIFEPLKMNNSGFDFRALKSRRKAVGYDDLNDSTNQRAVITDSSVPFGAGAIYSTVTDLNKWHRSLQNYSVVDKSIMDSAYEPGLLHNYGFGWQIDSVYGRKMASHSGSISGFGSNLARIPEDDICVALLNNVSGSTFDLMGLTNKIMSILYDEPYTLPKVRTPVSISAEVMKRYVGTYFVAEINLTIVVSIYGNRTLIAEPARDGHPGPTSVLVPLSETGFYDRKDTELELTFEKDQSGAVRGMTILQNGKTRFAAKTK
jgi:CubicO group peptidase (beta-lactamase class C family)